MKPKPPKIVKAPDKCAIYLTPGKIYEVINTYLWDDIFGYDFDIISDDGKTIKCSENFCSTLGQDWIIIEREQ